MSCDTDKLLKKQRTVNCMTVNDRIEKKKFMQIHVAACKLSPGKNKKTVSK